MESDQQQVTAPINNNQSTNNSNINLEVNNPENINDSNKTSDDIDYMEETRTDERTKLTEEYLKAKMEAKTFEELDEIQRKYFEGIEEINKKYNN